MINSSNDVGPEDVQLAPEPPAVAPAPAPAAPAPVAKWTGAVTGDLCTKGHSFTTQSFPATWFDAINGPATPSTDGTFAKALLIPSGLKAQADRLRTAGLAPSMLH